MKSKEQLYNEVIEAIKQHNPNWVFDRTPEYSDNPIIEYLEQQNDFRVSDQADIKYYKEKIATLEMQLNEMHIVSDLLIKDYKNLIKQTNSPEPMLNTEKPTKVKLFKLHYWFRAKAKIREEEQEKTNG